MDYAYEKMLERLNESVCCPRANVYLDELDGVKVGLVYFKKDMDGYIYFHINPYQKFTISRRDLFIREIKSFADFQKLFEDLPNLTFSKLHSVFVFKEHVDVDYLMSELLNPIHVKDYAECSVCLDHTMRKTKCTHWLCYACEVKLKNATCPMCRVVFENEEDE